MELPRRPSRLPSPQRFGSLAVLVASLAGCVVAPVGPGYREYHEDIVTVEPPPLRYEVVPVAPAIGWIWIGGYWGWRSNQYYWNPGRWSAPPGPGYGWAPHRWDRAGPGWREAPGRWQRR